MAAGSVVGVPSRRPSPSSLLVMVSHAAVKVRDGGQRAGTGACPPWPSAVVHMGDPAARRRAKPTAVLGN